MAYRRNLPGYRSKRHGLFSSLSITNLIIFSNVIFFLVFSIASFILIKSGVASAEKIISYVALSTDYVMKGYIWTFLTSMFMHGSFSHLFLNMISLFFVGTFVERLIGRKRFIWFYLISGLVAGLFFVGLAYWGSYISNGAAYFGTPSDFAVGASGALFGLAGLLAVLIPRLKVLVFFVIPMQMWLAMVVMLFGLWAISVSAGLPIGNTAHFGGLVVGVIYGFYLRNKYPRKISMLNKMFG